MKVLVTGATGFAGGHLARRLIAAGHEVRALVRPTASKDGLSQAGVEIFEGQLTTAEDVRLAAQGCEQIYHVAGAFRTAGHPDAYYYDVNVGGAQNVLAAAQSEGCERVLHCTTVGVLGNISGPPATEDTPYNPGDAYQRSKVEAEKLSLAAIAKGQRVVIFRPAPMYGEGDTRLLKLFRSIQKRSFMMIGPGRNKLHMVHIEDLCGGILLCGSREEAIGRLFMLAGPDAPTLNELAAAIAQALKVKPPPAMKIPLWPVMAAATVCEKLCVPLGVEPPLHRRRVTFFINNREFDDSRARRVLGYAPKIGLTEGVARTAAWYVSQGMLDPIR